MKRPEDSALCTSQRAGFEEDRREKFAPGSGRRAHVTPPPGKRGMCRRKYGLREGRRKIGAVGFTRARTQERRRRRSAGVAPLGPPETGCRDRPYYRREIVSDVNAYVIGEKRYSKFIVVS
jgi:hypothetical protein